MRSKNRVLVAMSGGVDSSLAACLVKQKGFETIGATMRLWPKEQCEEDHRKRACCSINGIEDARRVAAQLGIPYYVFDFHMEFKAKVIDYFCNEYAMGFTPNPCIACNEKIKFDVLLEKAKKLACDYIATGHYAGIGRRKRTGRYFIKEGRDRKKDQSYFLFSVPQKALARTILPLENMTKAQSRKLAKKMGLRTHNKKSSQEICFIPGHYSDYIKRRGNRDFREGPIVNNKGENIGRHKGIQLYTIGQRKGLGIAYKEPLYVTKIDAKNNSITVGAKKEAAKRSIIVKRPAWGPVEDIKSPQAVTVKIRYGHKKAKAVIKKMDNGKFKVNFENPQEAPAPGQAAVFYKNGFVLGGGWIESAIE